MRKVIPILLFNVVEIIFVFGFGLLLKTKLNTIIVIIGVWMLTRFLMKGPMHYKSPIKCFVMTLLLFISIFLATKVDLNLGILCVVFDAFIMSQHANIKDINENMFQWNNLGDHRQSKYASLIDAIQSEPDNVIILEYEKYWNENYQLRYQIFTKFFRERKTYEKIISELGLRDTTIIKNECKIIYSILEVPLKLKSLKTKC